MTEVERLMSDLEPIFLRPSMYFGGLEATQTAFELAAFINGYMAHRSGMMPDGFGMVCQADPDKTLAENAEVFKKQLLDWVNSPRGPANVQWRCCVWGPK